MKQDMSMVVRAAYFAAEKHKDQRRRDVDATPYINHPLELASILIDEGGIDDAVTICAALLHDTIEDTNTTREELATLFGKEIADIVVEVSDDKSLDPVTRKRLEQEHAPHLSHRAKLVKLADKTANIRDIATMPPVGWTLERKREYFVFARVIATGAQDASAQLFQVFMRDYETLSVK